MPDAIDSYISQLTEPDQAICRKLREALDKHAPTAESKVWHAHPVWFLDGNPIAGFTKLKGCVRLLFWSGRSFEEPGLEPEGKFKAAEARYESVGEVKAAELKRWIKKAHEIQWDYKSIVKRKGRLLRLE